MDKLKAFFTNKWTQLVAWLLIVIGALIAILGGATAETISGGVALVAGCISAIGALVAFIAKQIKK